MTKIPIAEDFFSIQGEGPFAGTPAVFLRLSGCNLCCGGWDNMKRDPENMEALDDATWYCDTIDVWRSAERVVDPEELVDEWDDRGWLTPLSGDTHLVITGGEPMMHQEIIVDFYAQLLREQVVPFVEVETNGTIEPEKELWRRVRQWNVSMKLSNSGMDYDERINPDAIEFFKSIHDIEDDHDAIFKFVVSDDSDLDEIKGLKEDFDIPDSMLMLMPAGQTQEQLRETYETTAEICKETGWEFSPRLQVDIWGEVTGV